ncbi:phthalate 4,5-dioxygenase, reductase subunit [Methylobacterium sp. 190mf]|uniref:PDR/VanB family oxidoreductase n=1 Tax=Methylobacterium sp. 190mf TaxID=1761798 RepID=UPI00089E4FD7|nr:PDR/VanB family oxidoreductase [Methylobacterium sp. 190mf]SEG66705.1 phthalate 4,5-dioxygenase, reductase subunit [Methylobacterium sp. 190mf]
MTSGNGMSLQIHARRMLTEAICEFDLRRSDGGPLPEFEAGSSLIVQTPSSERRNYSLCNDDRERHRYVIAVKREPTSRGGSQSMHDEAHERVVLEVELAQNGLRLGHGRRHLLVAGGIGITPMMSLIRRLTKDSLNEFRLLYLARSQAEAAYAEDLGRMELGGALTCHFSSEHGGRRFDIRPMLKDNGTGTHLYCCGPDQLMRSIGLNSIHWPRSHVHFERFGSLPKTRAGDQAFSVRQVSTGRIFHVGEDETILDSLRRADLKPDASCESGTCGKCRMTLVAGEADHRDMYLAPEDRLSSIMPCVSRAAGGAELELDF